MHENFFHKVKVYYEDTDSGGVVYYANYLKFLERARTEALFSIGYSNKKIKENFGIGTLVGTKWGILVYRLQETSSTGKLLFDRSMVIRFPMKGK